MNPLNDIAALFFPPVCAACGKPLPSANDFLCNYCRWEIPLTRFWERGDNPMAERLRAHIPVAEASAFYFFAHGTGFRDLIHDFKYRGRWRSAERMGRWYGAELAASGRYADVDVIVPVPLHLRKLLGRGYNQSEYIARGIAGALGRPVDTRSVARTVHTRSQATRKGSERWDNVEDIFRVRRPDALDGRHLLLVDDVLTTGATLLSMARTILRAAPACRISVATLATTQKE